MGRREKGYKAKSPTSLPRNMSTIKTTISIDEKLWREFSIRVIEERGNQKKNDVIMELIREYVERKRQEKNG